MFQLKTKSVILFFFLTDPYCFTQSYIFNWIDSLNLVTFLIYIFIFKLCCCIKQVHSFVKLYTFYKELRFDMIFIFNRDEHLLVCKLPKLSEMIKEENDKPTRPWKIPMLIMRSDGIIYPSDINLTLSREDNLYGWKSFPT